jgi:hypothetical protein
MADANNQADSYDHSCDDATLTGRSVDGSGGGLQNSAEREILATNDQRAVFLLRFLTLFILVVVTLIVCLASYFYASNNEKEDFEAAVYEQSTKVIATFGLKAESRIKALTSFSLGIVSHAHFANQTWPEGELLIESISPHNGIAASAPFDILPPPHHAFSPLFSHHAGLRRTRDSLPRACFSD